MRTCARAAAALAVLMLLGIGAVATASAEPNPNCQGRVGVQDAWLEPDSHFPGAVAGASGMANLCGTVEGPPGTTRYFYKDALLVMPAGADMACANPNYPIVNPDCAQQPQIAAGSFAGGVSGGIIGERGLNYGFVKSLTYVGNAPGRGTRPGVCNQRPVLGCYQAVDAASKLATSTIVVTKCLGEPQCAALGIPDADRRLAIHVYEPDPIGSTMQTYSYAIGTKSEPFTLCKYAGAPGTDACGDDPNGWLVKNPSRVHSFKCGGSLATSEGYVVYTYGRKVGPWGVYSPWDPPKPRWACIPLEITNRVAFGLM